MPNWNLRNAVTPMLVPTPIWNVVAGFSPSEKPNSSQSMITWSLHVRVPSNRPKARKYPPPIPDSIVGEFAKKGLVQPNTPKELPARRIERIKELIRDAAKVKVVLPDVDDRTAALAAYDFADLLRIRGNEAAHTRPAYDFEHAGETEEFLVSAGRHLPGIWSLADGQT